MIPDPISKTAAAVGSGNPIDAPPVLGNALALSALAVAAGEALDVDVALAVEKHSR